MKNKLNNIAQLFIEAANKHPERIAIIDKSRSISYSQLAKEVKLTASYYHNKGIKKGDRVMVFVPMGVDLYRIVLALFHIGATAVFLDEWVNKKRLNLCCDLAECQGFIGVFKARIFGFFSIEIRKIPIKLKLSKKDKTEIDLTPVNLSDSALITFTTGSTGIPKAADRSHGFLAEQFKVLIDKIEPHYSDIDMPALPIVLFINLGLGCTSIVADFKMTKPNSLNPKKILDQMKKHQVNRITGSPFFIKKLAEYSIKNKIENVNVKKLFTGGAPVFPNEAKTYLQGFPNAKSTIVYGSTEAEPISSITSEELVLNTEEIDKGLFVGKPYFKTQLKVIEITNKNIPDLTLKDLNSIEVTENIVGEIIVAGDHVLKTYFNNNEAFKANKIRIGKTIWHRTGDSGFIKNGNLYLTGRCQQLIQTENGYLSPFIIENQLQSTKGITCGTLLTWRKKTTLVVESKLSKTHINTLDFSFDYKEIILIKKIPMDPRHNSKIDYKKLKEAIGNL